MNELITLGISLFILVAAILIIAIEENFAEIKRFCKCVIEVIGERIFKAQTKYYKRRQRKRNKKMNKYFYMKERYEK